MGAIWAVLGSWMNPRAIAYRELYHIPQSAGTAVIVQAMVFGNQGRIPPQELPSPETLQRGKKFFFGEYLLNAQGEDVVSGIRTPEPLAAH